MSTHISVDVNVALMCGVKIKARRIGAYTVDGERWLVEAALSIVEAVESAADDVLRGSVKVTGDVSSSHFPAFKKLKVGSTRWLTKRVIKDGCIILRWKAPDNWSDILYEERTGRRHVPFEIAPGITKYKDIVVRKGPFDPSDPDAWLRERRSLLMELLEEDDGSMPEELRNRRISELSDVELALDASPYKV